MDSQNWHIYKRFSLESLRHIYVHFGLCNQLLFVSNRHFLTLVLLLDLEVCNSTVSQEKVWTYYLVYWVMSWFLSRSGPNIALAFLYMMAMMTTCHKITAMMYQASIMGSIIIWWWPSGSHDDQLLLTHFGYRMNPAYKNIVTTC